MIRTVLENIINTFQNTAGYNMISANSISSYGTIMKDVVVAGVASIDNDNTVLSFDICSPKEELFMYDTYEVLKADLQSVGLYDISVGKPKYNVVLECFVLPVSVKLATVFISDDNGFTPYEVKYKGVTFPLDITTYESGFYRNVKQFGGANGTAFSVNFGPGSGVIKGEAYFTPDHWETEYGLLKDFLSSDTSGNLVLPTGDSVSAFLRSFNVFFKKDTGKLKFAFEFVTA